MSDEIAWFVNVFTWKGKVFDPEKGELRNKILPMGHKAIVAKVYKDKSWFDQKGVHRPRLLQDFTHRDIGYAMRFAKLVPAFTSGWSTGVKEADPLRAPVSGFGIVRNSRVKFLDSCQP